MGEQMHPAAAGCCVATTVRVCIKSAASKLGCTLIYGKARQGNIGQDKIRQDQELQGKREIKPSGWHQRSRPSRILASPGIISPQLRGYMWMVCASAWQQRLRAGSTLPSQRRGRRFLHAYNRTKQTRCGNTRGTLAITMVACVPEVYLLHRYRVYN